MATRTELEQAIRACKAIPTSQSQAAVAEQAHDCIPIVEALGYYDLADILKRLSGTAR